ncbi:hypothetical protein [Rhodopila sp.]|uniref:hypothetical protein n=1 Tax=Rhodopila sp. TaxID=2480087 RepID=UPI003D09C08C
MRNPASPDTADKDPADKDPADKDPASPDTASPNPASPDPTFPDPASPNPAAKDPASETPTPKPTKPKPDSQPQLTPTPIAAYHRDAIFHHHGPFSPSFMTEAIRTLIRTLPLDPDEPQSWQDRRAHAALLGLAALHPRDEIEVMIGVQALAAYHAASACWRIGMNLRRPNGESTRHITTAASAARTFDAMLRALERRQVKPLAVPVGRPTPRIWTPADDNPSATMDHMLDRCLANQRRDAANDQAEPPPAWTEQLLAAAQEFLERERIEHENEGLDIANTEGILPGGGMIVMADPTPQQAAYLARRVGLQYRREFEENRLKGIHKLPKIRPIRPGDLIP